MRLVDRSLRPRGAPSGPAPTLQRQCDWLTDHFGLEQALAEPPFQGVWGVTKLKGRASDHAGMATRDTFDPATRDRSVRRLRQVTIGAAVAGFAATAGFGAVAAATHPGSSAATTTAVDTTSATSTGTSTTTGTAAANGTTTTPTVTATPQATAAPTPTTTTTTRRPVVTTGGS